MLPLRVEMLAPMAIQVAAVVEQRVVEAAAVLVRLETTVRLLVDTKITVLTVERDLTAAQTELLLVVQVAAVAAVRTTTEVQVQVVERHQVVLQQ
jgi:hypothetical protein